jgi:protein subunit release factor B
MTEPFKVEGIDYSPDGVAGVRSALVEMRGATFAHWPEAVDHTVVLTHAIALLSYTIELQRQHSEEELAHDFSQIRKHRVEHPEAFTCAAVMHHGPGHQSTIRCQRRDVHQLDEEHFALNPMEPGFHWNGADGSTEVEWP